MFWTRLTKLPPDYSVNYKFRKKKGVVLFFVDWLVTFFE